MGHILYDGTIIQFEDRVLAHLQIVIVRKFERKEPFLMSWKDSREIGDGRGSAWMSPTFPLYFKFLGSKTPEIDREWLELLGKSAESSTGLIVTYADGSLAESAAAPGQYPGNVMSQPRRRSSSQS